MTVATIIYIATDSYQWYVIGDRCMMLQRRMVRGRQRPHALACNSTCIYISLHTEVCCKYDTYIFIPFPEKWEELQYPFKRRVFPDKLCDIQDGKKYKKLMQPGKFLSMQVSSYALMVSSYSNPAVSHSGPSNLQLQTFPQQSA